MSRSRSQNPPGQLPGGDRPRGGHAVLIGGYAGSGKSTLGRIVARATGWALLDKDTLTGPVVDAALELHGSPAHDRDSPTYLDLIRPGEYRALWDAIAENLRCGNSVVAIAPFIREFDDDAWLTATKQSVADMGATLTVVWVHCTLDTMLRYLRQRGLARDTTELASWDDYAAGIDIDFRPPIEHVRIDNNPEGDSLESRAERLLADLLGNDIASGTS